MLGRIPTVEEYLDVMQGVTPMADEIYRYLNFNEMDNYIEDAKQSVSVSLN